MAAAGQNAGTRSNLEDVYPLSPLQEGMLFHTLLAPGEAFYLDQIVTTLLDPAFDAGAFRAACHRVQERHPVLRTAMAWKNRDKPLQVVLRQTDLPIQELDWGHLPEEERRNALESFLREDRRRGFDLTRAPLLRITLIRTSESSHWLLITYHHILMDAWSVPVVFGELKAFYEAFRQGRTLDLPLPRLYCGYIAWLQLQEPGTTEAFWRRTLQGFGAATPLPGARGTAASSERIRRESALSEELTAELELFSRRQGVTLSTLVQAAWALVLGRYARERDVVFGLTVSGRPPELPGVESMVGLFINTLPMRVRMPSGQSLTAWLRELQMASAALRSYEHVPLVEILRWSGVPPGLPLFETLLVFENIPGQSAAGGGQANGFALGASRYETRTNFTAVLVARPGASLSLDLQVDPARIDAEVADRLLPQMANLLTAFVENPERRLEDLSLLTREEGVDLPDRPRPAVATHRGASRSIALPQELSREIAALARREGATLFMVLVAGFAALLGRVTGQEDLVVGSPVAGRSRREVEDLVGCFVNTVTLRLSVAGDPSFSELLGRVRRVALEAYAHQDLPFERLVEELQPVRDLGRTPVFQVMCALQNVPIGALEIPPLRLEPLAFEVTAAKFDLTLSLEETPSGLLGTWEFSRDLFDEVTVRRMAGHFESLLAAAVDGPAMPLSRLGLLAPGERHQLLAEWNDSAVAWPRQALIHELFENQVRRDPEAVAVTFRGRDLTYAELDAWANRLAWWLLARGVGTDRLVAVLVERSLEMIVALLGILKAGGAYAPLEPGTPPQRLRFLLEDIASPVLLTQEALRAEIEEAGGFAGPVLSLDRDPLADEPADPPGRGGHPDQLAYVNYTSGSTGTPKGVIVPHVGVTRLVCNPAYMPFLPDDRFLQLSTYAWDAATWEIWGALLNGGCLVMIPKETVLDFPALARTLVEERITALYLTTALFNQVVESAWEGLVGLRTLIVGGETASVPHFRRAVELLPGTRIINEYGPTENTSFSSWERVERVPEVGGLSIGRPLTNSTVHVLDRGLEPVPVGVTGELYLGGDGLARGYLGRPGVTAERFVPSPVGCGERLYRSGDLGFWMADGRLGFLGRTDFQVKVRGHRIEMAEVEAAVKLHPGVLDAVVVAFEPTPQDRQLAAYVVPRRLEKGPDAAGLRGFLAESLPDYMVPAAFVFLESIPLTGTGKADRKALPAPSGGRPDLGSAYVAPRTPREQALAEIWAEVLGVERVGVHDSFLRLGGHSLLALRLISQIQRRLGHELPMSSLFGRGTVAALAELLAGDGKAGAGSCLVPLQPEGDGPPFFCVHPGGGNIFCYKDLAAHLGTEQPFYGIQARGREEGEEPLATVDEMATHYLDAVVRVQPHGPFFLGGWSFGGLVAYEMARRLLAAGESVGLVALLDCAVGTGGEAQGQDDAEILADLLGNEAGFRADEVRRLGGLDEQIEGALAEARRRGVSLDLDLPRARRLFALYKANSAASHAYEPGPYPGKVTLFQATDRPSNASLSDLTLGWGAVAHGGLEIVEISGRHETLVVEPSVERLAERLREFLTTVRSPGSRPPPQLCCSGTRRSG